MEMKELLAKIGQMMVFPEPELTRENTALMLIDMQKLAGPEFILWEAEEAGVDRAEAEKAVAEFGARMKEATLNAARVLKAAREKDLLIAHTRIECRTKDGRDVGRIHKRLNFVVPPGSEWAEWMPEVAPIEGEVVLTKTCSSFFTGTSIDTVLRNADIENLIIVGFYTEQCVTTAARDAADTFYYTIVVSDAVQAQTQEKHETALDHICGLYVNCMATDEIVDLIEKL